jgi:hypothetical protein
MTVPLTRHQHLEVCRLYSGRLLILCLTLAPVRMMPPQRARTGWYARVVWSWPKEGRR